MVLAICSLIWVSSFCYLWFSFLLILWRILLLKVSFFPLHLESFFVLRNLGASSVKYYELGFFCMPVTENPIEWTLLENKWKIEEHYVSDIIRNRDSNSLQDLAFLSLPEGLLPFDIDFICISPPVYQCLW